jgi:hypothetical protein
MNKKGKVGTIGLLLLEALKRWPYARWSLSRSIPTGHVFPYSCGGFWMFTPIGGKVYLSMY